jgi:DNA-binding transcriptional regulator YbjK
MSDMDKAAKAKASKAANAAKRKEAMYELVGELRPKYPQLDQPELEKLAMIEMRRKALEQQAQKVLNPRVNSKADTKKKIIIGALVLTAAAKDHEVRKFLRGLLTKAELKESDKKLFADLLFPADPTPAQPQAAQQPTAPAQPRPQPTYPQGA